MLIDLMSLNLDNEEIDKIIQNSLIEDLGENYLDVTTDSLISNDISSIAYIKTREKCVISGMDIAKNVFQKIDPALDLEVFYSDGDKVQSDQALLKVSGSAASILKGERVALNFLQRMCGISSLTAEFLKKSNRQDLLILDTRKTTPGIRIIEKLAVKYVGVTNHRKGLFDAVMIKDNHFLILERENNIGINSAIKKVRAKNPNLQIHVEVDTVEQLKKILSVPPDWVLLDNMSINDLKKCVKLCQNKCKTEASGDISLENIKEVASTGIDAVSIGALTHSAKSVNLGLDFLV